MARPVFIVGCQRSGTTALHGVIGRSPEVRARGEGDPAAMSSENRLLSQPKIDDLLASEPLPVLALKPICDSHYTDEMLRRHPGRAVWLVRDYRDVSNSIVVKWPGHMEEVRRRFADGDLAWLGWRAERLGQDRLEEIAAQCRAGLSEHSVAAMFWQLRNRAFFDQALEESPVVLPVSYERLVRTPETEGARLFAFAEIPFDPSFVAALSPRSIGREPAPELDAAIDRDCRDLTDRFRALAGS